MSDPNACRICGFMFNKDPRGEDGKSPLYWICPCCGGEVGVDDANLERIREYRRKWLFAGAPWFDSEEKSRGWKLQEQLPSVPEDYR